MAQLQGISPIVPVRDVAATAAFFRDVLHFDVRTQMDDGSFALVAREHAGVSLVHTSDEKVLEATANNISAYIWVEKLDALWDELKDGEAAPQAAGALVGELELLLPLAGLIDVDAERARKRKDIERADRDEEACQAALARLTEGARGQANLLELCVAAAQARATVGEMSDAMEEVFGRHRADTKLVSGVYAKSYEGADEFDQIRAEVETFAREHGRRPRILVVKMGQDGHDRGAKVIATSFADLGFDVDVGPLFQTPAEAARDAVDNDVHIVGVSSQAAGHKTLVPELITELAKLQASHVVVVCGGVIPPQDYDFLSDAGVAAIFGPGTNIIDAARTVLSVTADAAA